MGQVKRHGYLTERKISLQVRDEKTWVFSSNVVESGISTLIHFKFCVHVDIHCTVPLPQLQLNVSLHHAAESAEQLV